MNCIVWDIFKPTILQNSDKIYRFNEIPIRRLPKVIKYRKTEFRRNKISTERTAHFSFAHLEVLEKWQKILNSD
jgi:hypothetical protein